MYMEMKYLKHLQCGRSQRSCRLLRRLPTIRAEMDRAGVGFVYKEEPKETWSPALLAAAEPAAAPPAAVVPKGAAHEPGEAATLAPDEQAMLEKIQQRLKDGAQVVVVIRSGRDGQEKNEVIGLNHPSPAFRANWQPPTAVAGTCTTPPWSGRRSWSGTRRLVISTTSRSPAADRPVRKSLRRRGASNIDDHLGQPAVAVAHDLQAVPGDGLHFHVELMPGRVDRLALGRGRQALGADGHREAGQQQPPRLENIKQLGQPIAEQFVGLCSGDGQLDGFAELHLVQVGHHDGEQRPGGLGEKIIQALGPRPQPHVGGVLEEFVHAAFLG